MMKPCRKIQFYLVISGALLSSNVYAADPQAQREARRIARPLIYQNLLACCREETDPEERHECRSQVGTFIRAISDESEVPRLNADILKFYEYYLRKSDAEPVLYFQCGKTWDGVGEALQKKGITLHDLA